MGPVVVYRYVDGEMWDRRVPSAAELGALADLWLQFHCLGTDGFWLATGQPGREVLRASIDDFHRRGHKFRSQRDEWTPRSYYDEGYDYAAFRDLLLRPLGPHGTRKCRTGVFDSFHDVWLAEEWHAVGANCVLVVDGAFLQRPELCTESDYVIWLDVDMETMVERARHRDVAWVGSEEVVVGRYRRRVGPTHALYEQLVQPRDYADAVVDMRDLTAPRILRLGQRLG